MHDTYRRWPLRCPVISRTNHKGNPKHLVVERYNGIEDDKLLDKINMRHGVVGRTRGQGSPTSCCRVHDVVLEQEEPIAVIVNTVVVGTVNDPYGTELGVRVEGRKSRKLPLMAGCVEEGREKSSANR
jgi:hypothetical protein